MGVGFWTGESGGDSFDSLNIHVGTDIPSSSETGLFIQTSVDPVKIFFSERQYGAGTWLNFPLPASVSQIIYGDDGYIYMTVAGTYSLSGDETSAPTVGTTVYKVNPANNSATGFVMKDMWYPHGTHSDASFGYNGLSKVGNYLYIWGSEAGIGGSSYNSFTTGMVILNLSSGLFTKLDGTDGAGSNGYTFYDNGKIGNFGYGTGSVYRSSSTSSHYYYGLKTVIEYDPNSGLFSTLTSSIPSDGAYGMADAQRVKIGRDIYTIGGHYYCYRSSNSSSWDSYGASDRAYRFNLDTKLFTSLKNAPIRLFSAGTFSSGSLIYMLGGVSGNQNNVTGDSGYTTSANSAMYVYDTDLNTYSVVMNPATYRENTMIATQTSDRALFLMSSSSQVSSAVGNKDIARVYYFSGTEYPDTSILIIPSLTSTKINFTDLDSSMEFRIGVSGVLQMVNGTMVSRKAYYNNGTGWTLLQ